MYYPTYLHCASFPWSRFAFFREEEPLEAVVSAMVSEGESSAADDDTEDPLEADLGQTGQAPPAEAASFSPNLPHSLLGKDSPFGQIQRALDCKTFCLHSDFVERSP